MFHLLQSSFTHAIAIFDAFAVDRKSARSSCPSVAASGNLNQLNHRRLPLWNNNLVDDLTWEDLESTLCLP